MNLPNSLNALIIIFLPKSLRNPYWPPFVLQLRKLRSRNCKHPACSDHWSLQMTLGSDDRGEDCILLLWCRWWKKRSHNLGQMESQGAQSKECSWKGNVMGIPANHEVPWTEVPHLPPAPLTLLKGPPADKQLHLFCMALGLDLDQGWYTDGRHCVSPAGC